MDRNAAIGIGAIVVLLLGVAYLYTSYVPSVPVVSAADETEARAAVIAFGGKMQMVSLLASTTGRTEAMNQQYGAYVAPELLARWYTEGAEGALGRYTSSPWPDRIEIVEVRSQGRQVVVEGNVIEVTSAEMATGEKEAAAVYPVTLTLEKRNGNWLIVAAQKGAYSELPQRRSIVGYWECLPHRDRTGPQTDECAFGIAVDQSDGHYAVNTMLMSTYPVDVPTGTKVRVSGVVTPVQMLSSEQRYDIDGIINATTIEKIN